MTIVAYFLMSIAVAAVLVAVVGSVMYLAYRWFEGGDKR